jgi:glycosyltransferase involved in cell wall biosynthesis
MRILFYSPICPWPPDEGGKLRIMGVLTELAKRHDVTVLTTIRRPGDREGVDHLRTLFPRVLAVELPWSRGIRLWHMLVSYLCAAPFLAVIYRDARLRRAVAEAAREHDAVHAEYPYGAQLIEGLHCLKVMDTHNVEADVLLGNSRRSASFLRKLHHRLQAVFMRRFELTVAARMDAVLACSDADRDFFLAVNENSITVPNAVESVQEREFPPGRDVVFTGLMSYLANVEGIRWFCAEVWPQVTARVPDARLWIVGKDPAPGVVALAGANVTVTGRVEDVSGYYRRARVFVCPLRVGSGTRLKILQALSFGVAVVSTGVGCSGLDVTSGEHLLVADNARGFADAVLVALTDESLARGLGQAGRELTRRRYTWAATVETLNEKVYRPCA